MSNLGSIISSIVPEVLDVASSLLDLESVKKVKTVVTAAKPKPNNVYTTPKPKEAKAAKVAKVAKLPDAPANISQTKDICEQDCICDDIKLKNAKSQQSRPKLLDINSNDFSRYIVYSEILGPPTCKRNR